MPLDTSIKKVLVIGSGPIVIGQAAEFDYAGAQACRILKKAGINTVLVNSNPATIMTDGALADEIYLEPLTLTTVKRIIKKEKPDGILAGLGGQTGLTLAMQLHNEGFLEKNNVRLLGTNAEAIIKAEDREIFKETMRKIGQPLIPSETTTDLHEALSIAKKIGYPVIIRPAFTLGGFGGGVAYTEEECVETAKNGLNASPIHQILVEKYIYGWKEIEFEVIRDGAGNALAVCSMENVDPVGVHTGDSIVVAPALTLSVKEYGMLRAASLAIISELGIEGGCNCQFALDPESDTYAVIEVNPRVSRSSALASKATGYPIAKVTVQIALGYRLDEIENEITGKTTACLEPTVDYVVLKFPKWPFDKFVYASRTLGTQMKATGEVMSIGTCFESALLKAVRGAEIALDTLNTTDVHEDIIADLSKQDDRRLFTVFAALKEGVSVEKIHEITKIDEYFISKLKGLLNFERGIAKNGLDKASYEKGKYFGYTDRALERISKSKIPYAKAPSYKVVDTCGGEFSAEKPYFYSTFDGENEAEAFLQGDKKRIVVLGSGPIRIGQGIEFDYSSVHCVWALKEMGYEVAIINNNPETVSTDFDIADRLYFEPLTPEDVKHILDLEKPIGVVVAFGGQTAIKLTKFLDGIGMTLLGTSADGIDMAEDRERFETLLERCGISRPAGCGVMTKKAALLAANKLGYPVLVRPSYVIGGQNMTIAFNDGDVSEYMDIILKSGIENPVLVDKYLMGRELEIDVISDGEQVLIPGIMEHIERAGVHSGDSIAVYPPYNLNDEMTEKVVACGTRLALELKTKGLVNIQFIVYQNELYVIEVNPRASRTIPYISKVTGVPMVDIAAKIMLGGRLSELGYGTGLYKKPPYVAVKVPVFSFEKLSDVNSLLGPEMKSTGEVLGLGKTLEEAMFKGLVSAGFRLNYGSMESSGVYISVGEQDKPDVVTVAKKFYDLGLTIYATKGTAKVIASLGNDIVVVNNEKELFSYIEKGQIRYVVNTCPNSKEYVKEHIRLRNKAIRSNIACMSSLDTARALADTLASRFNEGNTELVDINALRKERMEIPFMKMQSLGNDYIYIDNSDGKITCPESIAIPFCHRNFGIGGNGIVLIEKPRTAGADASMRIFNKDGSKGMMAGNSIHCVGKYLYDTGKVKKKELFIDTANGTSRVKLFLTDGKVSSATADMGRASLSPEKIPVKSSKQRIINESFLIGGREYGLTCLSVGNPHAVVFMDTIDGLDLERLGRQFEFSEYFPERINTEFVRIIDGSTLKMRVWERGNGETLCCGTGACAAAYAAVLNGFCSGSKTVTVKVKGGDVYVAIDGDRVSLTGSTELVFEGKIKL